MTVPAKMDMGEALEGVERGGGVGTWWWDRIVIVIRQRRKNSRFFWIGRTGDGGNFGKSCSYPLISSLFSRAVGWVMWAESAVLVAIITVLTGG